MNSIVYPIGDCLYLNITNRCTNQCEFCIRYKTRLFNQKYPLWLDREPTAEEIMEAIGDPSRYKQIVFCGYGEPLVRLDAVKTIASRLKTKDLPMEARRAKMGQRLKTKIRIDTNGTANLFWGRNILPELKGLFDIMSVSLDAENAEVYERICMPLYGKRTYSAVLDFIKEAKKYIPQVEATVVDLPLIDITRCQEIAKQLGVHFRIRPYYEEKYLR